MNVGRMKHLRPSPRCMDILRSDLKEHLRIDIFMTTREHSPLYRLWSGKEDAAETAMHQSAAE